MAAIDEGIGTHREDGGGSSYFFLCSLLTVDGFIAGLARPLIFSALFLLLLLLLLLLMFSIRRTFGFGRGLDI